MPRIPFFGSARFLILLLTIVVMDAYSQTPDSCSSQTPRDSIQYLVTALKQADTEDKRDSVNMQLLTMARRILETEDQLSSMFGTNSIPALVEPEDRHFAMVLWNVQGLSGKHRYHGFIRFGGADSAIITPLIDGAVRDAGTDTLILDASRWYGALYYKIISCQDENGLSYYTLLGWSGINHTQTSKVIEILTFDQDGRPVFGLPVFMGFEDDRHMRVIFRYSASTSMTLKYDNRIVETKKTWNTKKRVFDETPVYRQLISADRLHPMDPVMEGQFDYYIPAGDIMDGFLMEKGYWRYISGLEGRN